MAVYTFEELLKLNKSAADGTSTTHRVELSQHWVDFLNKSNDEQLEGNNQPEGNFKYITIFSVVGIGMILMMNKIMRF